jgi:hypothetical protein
MPFKNSFLVRLFGHYDCHCSLDLQEAAGTPRRTRRWLMDADNEAPELDRQHKIAINDIDGPHPVS